MDEKYRQPTNTPHSGVPVFVEQKDHSEAQSNGESVGRSTQTYVVSGSSMHNPLDTIHRPHRRAFPLKQIIAALFALAILVLVARTIALRATPEDASYSFKTRVYEPALSRFHFGSAAKVANDLVLIRQRFVELHALANDEATSTSETIQTVLELEVEHALHAHALLKDDSLAAPLRIPALGELSVLLNASEQLTEHTPEFLSASTTFGNLRSEVSDTLKEAAAVFATTSRDEVNAFLAEHIALVSEGLTHVAQGSRAQKQAMVRAQDASEAVGDGDMAFAIVSIMRAREALALDDLLYAAERGEGTIRIVPPETTEGQ